MMRDFLPISRDDMKSAAGMNWISSTSLACLCGPSPLFGQLLSPCDGPHGYKVGIISQPDWKMTQSVMALGVPGLISCRVPRNMDSAVDHMRFQRNVIGRLCRGGVTEKKNDMRRLS